MSAALAGDRLALPGESTPIAEAAAMYASAGLSPIPLYGIRGGRCGCGKQGCLPRNAGKHPMGDQWQKRASSDIEVVRDVFEGHDGNVGIYLGGSHVLVDVDGPEGLESVAQLGEMPETLAAVSGSGGLHYIFKLAPHQDSSAITDRRIAPGLDIKVRGQFVAAPSLHCSGGRYRWRSSSAPAVLPDWLYERIKKLAPKPRAIPVPFERGSKTLERVRKYVAKMPEAIAGDGGHPAAFAVARKIVGNGLSEGEEWQLMSEYNARCRPPWSDAELEHKLRSAREHGQTTGLPERALVPIPATAIAVSPANSNHAGTGSLAKTDRLPQLSDACPAADECRSRVVRLADVEPESVTWLWRGRIPLGKITVLDGDPGLGKSTMVADLVARLTTGRPFPDETEAPDAAAAVYIAHEDGIADTLRPRLDAAGADVTLVHALAGFTVTEGGERLPVIPGDVDAIAAVVRNRGARLLVIDPLYAYLDSNTDSFRDHDIRAALVHLATMAEKTGTAVLLIRHLRKSGNAPALYRGSGSIGISGLARSVLLLAKDPEDENARILASVKSNLGPPPQSLKWRLGGAVSQDLPPRVDWEGTTDHTADQLVNVGSESNEERSARDEAEEFLRLMLAAGPALATEATRQAKQAGISEITLRRARTRLGVKSVRRSFSGKWEWELPEVPKVLMFKQGAPSGEDGSNGHANHPETGQEVHPPQGAHPQGAHGQMNILDEEIQ